jgi:antitoxin MazE
MYLLERMLMRTRVHKWGNSLALRIPKSFAADAGIEDDSAVEVTLQDGAIVIEPVASPTYSLAQLLVNITPENLHAEVDTGEATGREAW